MTIHYVPQRAVPWQASASPAGPARASGAGVLSRVQALGTTAGAAELQGNSEWWADLEYVWRKRTEAARCNLESKCKLRYKEAATSGGGQAVKLLRSAEWYDHRARALGLARADVIATCRKRWRATKCGCGELEHQVGCDAVQLCAWCRKRHWRKWRRRITKALTAHHRGAMRTWNAHRRGMMPGIYLITLTGPHTGDLEADRRALGRAWREFSKVANAERWWSAYAMTWEATPGESGDGHLHMHVAALSTWLPYEQLHEVWRAVMPGARVLDVQAPKHGRKAVGRAANYLAKYVTKGIEPSEFTGRKAGELLVAMRGKRKVTTSTRFWLKQESCCSKCLKPWTLSQSPVGLQDIAPHAVLKSMAERYRWWVPRGAPQVEVRWSG